MIQLSSGVFTFGFLIPALGAALIGRFRHVWPTVVTGLAIGMVQSTFTKMQGDISWFPRVRRPRGSAVPGDHRRDGGARRAAARPRCGRHLEAAGRPAGQGDAGVGRRAGVAAVAGLLLLGPLWRGAIMTTMIAVGARAVVRGAHRVRRPDVARPDGVRRRRRVRAVEAGDAVGHPVPDRADRCAASSPRRSASSSVSRRSASAARTWRSSRSPAASRSPSSSSRTRSTSATRRTGGAKVPNPEARRLGLRARPRHQVVAADLRHLPRRRRAGRSRSWWRTSAGARSGRRMLAIRSNERAASGDRHQRRQGEDAWCSRCRRSSPGSAAA